MHSLNIKGEEALLGEGCGIRDHLDYGKVFHWENLNLYLVVQMFFLLFYFIIFLIIIKKKLLPSIPLYIDIYIYIYIYNLDYYFYICIYMYRD
jgi:hypothetical protein